jgi:hypothetical protein
VGIALYHALEAWRPGAGAWSLILPLVLVGAGSREFTAMRRLRESRSREA